MGSSIIKEDSLEENLIPNQEELIRGEGDEEYSDIEERDIDINKYPKCHIGPFGMLIPNHYRISNFCKNPQNISKFLYLKIFAVKGSDGNYYYREALKYSNFGEKRKMYLGELDTVVKPMARCSG